MKKALLFFFILFSIKLSAATLTATQSGNWSDATTWGGIAPTGTTDVVSIGAGFTVTLTGATAASSLVLNGNLIDAGFVLTLSKTNSTVLSSTSGGTHSGSGSITLTGNKLLKVTASTGFTITLGNLIINQSAAATGYNNICEIGGGTVVITGTLTITSGVFALNTKTLVLSSPVIGPSNFTGADIYTGNGSGTAPFSGLGTLIPATGSITLNTNTATIPNPTVLTTLMNITINVGGGNTYTLTNPLTLAPNTSNSGGNLVITSGTLNTGANALTFTAANNTSISSIAPGASLVVANSGSINFNGLPVTIKSDATGTGAIGSSAGTISGATAVTAQRYIGSSNQWRMIGFPFGSGTSISASALTTLYGLNYNAYTFTESLDNGNYGNTGTFNAGWSPFTSGTVTSDKGILLIGGTPTTIISALGTLNSGAQSIALNYSGSSKGWNFIANPFASNIGWVTIKANALNAIGLDNAIYRNNPTTGTYSSYVNGVGVNGGDPVIENGAGFFVHSTGATSLTINESDKVSTAPAVTLFGLQPTTPQEKSIIKLSLIKQGETYGDEAVVRWGVDPATDGFDGKFDAYDLGRAVGADLSVIGKDGTTYSIFHGSALQTKDKEQREIALGTKNMTEGNYSLNTSLLSDMYDGNEVYLVDHYRNQTSLISTSTEAYPFIVSSDQASASPSRFSIALNYKAKLNIPSNDIVLLNNPSTTGSFSLASGTDFQKVSWQLVDNSGRTLQSGTFNGVTKGSVNTTATQNLPSGMYFIKLIGDAKVLQTQKWIKQ